MFKTREWNHAIRAGGQLGGQMKSVNGVKKKQRPDALIQIFAAPAEGLQLRAGGEQFICRGAGAAGVQRLVADF